MKSPELAEIPEPTPDASFNERAKGVKDKAAKKPKSKAGVKLSISVHPDDETYINNLAMKLGKKRGKLMSASEAVRVMIDHHRTNA